MLHGYKKSRYNIYDNLEFLGLNPYEQKHFCFGEDGGEGGGISNGDNIKVTYDNPAKTIEGVNALKSKTIEKYVYFYGNPDTGVTQKIIGRATISPSGDFSFIQDAEWQQMTLDIEFLEDANVDGLFEYCGSGVTGN